MSARWTLRCVACALALSGAVVACYNDVPGPLGPLPSPRREAPPMGPTPGPILPPARLTEEPDAGVPVPSLQPASYAVPAAAPPDAGVIDSPADLPADIPDAGAEIKFDAGVRY